ncbi:MAG: hypothetical protein HY519_01805 [Candidatus Aenigmarchaeota archaeon]|nr:hypothetical protein [Candidatus Aenigmarchaeota archaeon]
MKAAVETLEEFVMVIAAFGLAILLLSILFGTVPRERDLELSGNKGQVSKQLADLAAECFQKHRNGLDPNSDVCFIVSMASQAAIGESDITMHLPCLDMPNSDCIGCSACTSGRFASSDTLSVRNLRAAGLAKVSYSGAKRAVEIAGLGCSSDADCSDFNACTADECVNPGTEGSFCRSTKDCAACNGPGVIGSDWCDICYTDEQLACTDGIDNDCNGQADSQDNACNTSVPPRKRPQDAMNVFIVALNYQQGEIDDFKAVANKWIDKWVKVSPFKECAEPRSRINAYYVEPKDCDTTCRFAASNVDLGCPKNDPTDCINVAYKCATQSPEYQAIPRSERIQVIGLSKSGLGILGGYACQTNPWTAVADSGQWEATLQEITHSLGIWCHTCGQCGEQTIKGAELCGQGQYSFLDQGCFPGDIMDYCPNSSPDFETFSPKVYAYLKEKLKTWLEGCG